MAFVVKKNLADPGSTWDSEILKLVQIYIILFLIFIKYTRIVKFEFVIAWSSKLLYYIK